MSNPNLPSPAQIESCLKQNIFWVLLPKESYKTYIVKKEKERVSCYLVNLKIQNKS